MMLRLADCSAKSPCFNDLVSATAARLGVEARAVSVRALQQLPRVASPNGWISEQQLRQEIWRSASRARSEVEAAADHVPRGEFTLADLHFRPVDATHAEPLLRHLHYLGSVRRESLYFALVDPDTELPVALSGVSALQWPRLERRILDQWKIPKARILDLSRSYSIDSAPHNCMSTLLSRVRNWVRSERPEVELLTTVVDPNLGFTGSCYRAANWQQWLTIEARRYLYEDEVFVTPRQLRERFGTSRMKALRRDPQHQFEESRPRLSDSLLYCSRVKGSTERVPVHQMGRLRRSR